MKTERQNVGKRGEDEACRYLLEKGQTILERNWRGGRSEIDIITLDKAGVHFVEVKTRTAPATADPLDNVKQNKLKMMIKGSNAYLRGNRNLDRDIEIFFDLVSVLFYPDHAEVEYFPQAFIPLYL